MLAELERAETAFGKQGAEIDCEAPVVAVFVGAHHVD